jgi:alkaline phosphatase D
MFAQCPVRKGDYIYEYGRVESDTAADGWFNKDQSREPIGEASQPPGECVTLSDYRTRYAQYRTDADLRELYRMLPWIIVPDDHEVREHASSQCYAN